MKAHDLCVYTLQITANDKIFKAEYRAALTDKIIATALNIHTLAWSANNVIVKGPEDLKGRNRLQDEAVIQCNVLLSLIEIAKSLFHLSTKRVIYWSAKAIETRNLIRAWKESDKKRFRKNNGV